jgi:hypothetical protein
MSQTGTSAWWADVQYLRDAAERTDEARRRADRAELAARRANRDRRRVEAETAPTSQPRRLEPDLPPPRRRDHVEPDAAVVPRRGGYGDAVALPDRRTVEIRGRTVPAPAVPRTIELDRRRPPRRAAERVGPRPDRLALWALLMGLVLILVAVSTAHAATLAVVAGL